ncbi:MAG TPA: heme A synthase [Devosia sp.]|nr:heme A synthase [Devosia sp.]
MRPVRVWLYVLAFAIVLMVAVGGITRLTDSGLSITSWKPISGMLPPLSRADWMVEFEAYQQIPEFQLQNNWMDLEAFKSIFWWEWGHRFLGRIIGLMFAIPFVVFLVQKRLNWRLAPSLALLFVLGGFQGFLGWWMVSSGLTERVDVSQYRLAAHLGAASLLLAAIIWVARRLRPERRGNLVIGNVIALQFLALLVFLQIILGAFVAGLDAGYGFNTWPLMEGRWIPEGLATLEPMWRNLFENLLTVQFTHRLLAYIILLYVVIWLGIGWLQQGFLELDNWLKIIALLVVGQVVLGILTLVYIVPIPLAIGHQTLAFMLFASIFAALADQRG